MAALTVGVVPTHVGVNRFPALRGERDRIAIAELFEHALKLGPCAAGAGDLLAEDLLTVRLSEGLQLSVQVLIQGRHPRIADVHNLASGCGKKPRKTMKFCQGILQTEIASKTRSLANGAKVRIFANLCGGISHRCCRYLVQGLWDD
jgi:hypothetical protein